MKSKALRLALLLLVFVTGSVAGQDSLYTFSLQGLGGYTTPGVIPFWLRANQFGSIPLDGASMGLISIARKDYDFSGNRLFDWGASFEGRANLGQGSNLTLIEGYGKVRFGVFELRAGRSKKITGLCDSTLTSGSWPISGSNLGIPEIELSVRNFWPLPWFGQLFALKGNYSHGWVGEMPMNQYWADQIISVKTYFHQKSIYGRLGKPSWKIELYAGINHQTFWCMGDDYYPQDFDLSPLENYYYIFSAKPLTNTSVQDEILGNHVGSVDLGAEFILSRYKIFVYRQNIYEAGALKHLVYKQDGLNGISIINRKTQDKKYIWDKILFEFLYTKNQAGAVGSPDTASYDPYFNHWQYIEGWSYLSQGLGTSFINTRKHIRAELATHPLDYFVNNRIKVYHFGVEGTIAQTKYVLVGSYSKNYGTYRTTDEEQSAISSDPGAFGLFGEKKQFSGYLELDRRIKDNFKLGLVGAFDVGELYYNSYGVFLRAVYSLN